jgi:uroporphyrinogen-III synthase
VCSSDLEGLQNFIAMLGGEGAKWLKTVPIFVSHPNIEQAGRNMGLTQLVVAQGGDEAILQGIIGHMAKPT